MASKEAKTYGIVIGLIILIIVSYSIKSTKMEPQIQLAKPEWLQRYSAFISMENISNEYLVETPYYDYNSPLVQTKINQLLAVSDSPKEYVENAAELVYIDIDYDYNAKDTDCTQGTGSKNFLSGKGDCTEQGMSLITLLRGAGIPARAVGGCLYRSKSSKCDLFAAVPFKQPRYKELTKEDIESGIFSRKQAIGSRAGGLHLYLEVFIDSLNIGDSMILNPSKRTQNGAWVIVEPTTGEIVNKNSCYNYDEELVVPNDRKDLFCTSDNKSYSLYCASLGG